MNFEMLFDSFRFVLLALVLVLALVPPLKMLAPKIGLIDHPCERKAHEGIVPLIGGIVIFPVFIILSLLSGAGLAGNWPLYSAILILLITGAIDDRRHLPAFLKFGVQFVAAFLVVVPGGAELKDLGNLFGLGVFELGWMSVPFSIVAMVLLINAVNLMDGVDGLAGGTVFIILGWFLFGCIAAGGSGPMLSIALLMACVGGFLFYNMRSPWRAKAAIFMGDAGSLCLGLMIGWYAIHLSPQEGRVLEPMAVAWILAVPIWDECAQFYRRVCEGRHPFSPDRGHFHHHFERAGISPGCASLTIHALTLIMGGLGVFGSMMGLPLPVLTVLWIVGILAHMGFSKNLERYTRLLQGITKPRSSA
jgi:UDP-GlcNAc:undecaprenyl-phosphate GlcNAc-1-phosphate transferase